MNEKLKCKWCEVHFEPKRPWQTFCCTDHQQRWHRQRQRQLELPRMESESEQLSLSL